jgi:hypothetical protein
MSRHFPHWLKAYVEHTRISEAPDTFHFWTGVATIAGALRRRVWIDELAYQWVPNFYIVLVGPPGIVTKSTTVGLGMRMLRQIKGINFGPEATTWQKLTESLQQAAENVTIHTPEGEITKEMSCITCEVSELGTFFRFDDDAFMSVLIDLWDGKEKPWLYSTLSRGETNIPNPWLNIIGCTTPAWLQKNFPEHMIGGGLTSRTIFVFGEKKRRLIAYPSQETLPADYKDVERKLVEDLMLISTMAGEYKFTSAARKWGADWYEKHWSSVPLHMASERYGGYRARKQGHMHKLAMILAAAQRPQLIIEREDLEMAEQLLKHVEPDMIKVFESIGVVDEAKNIGEIYSFVKAYGWIEINQLWTLCRNIMPKVVFTAAVRQAIEDGYFIPLVRDNKRGVTVREGAGSQKPS